MSQSSETLRLLEEAEKQLKIDDLQRRLNDALKEIASLKRELEQVHDAFDEERAIREQLRKRDAQENSTLQQELQLTRDRLAEEQSHRAKLQAAVEEKSKSDERELYRRYFY